MDTNQSASQETTPAAAPAEEQGVKQTAAAEQKEQTKEQQAAEKRKFKLKINGRESEFDEDTVLALAQKGQASDEKFRKAAEERKKIETVLKKFKDDPDAAIEAILGKPAEELYKERIAKKLEQMAKSPEELEADKLKQELERYKKAESEAKQQEQMKAQKAIEEQYVRHYNDGIPKAIASAGLPQTPEVLATVAQILSDANDDGVDMPLQAAAELAKERLFGFTEKFIKNGDLEKIYDILGDDFVTKLSTLAMKKRPQAVKDSPVIAKKDDDSPRERKTLTLSEVRERAKNFK